MQIRNLQVIKRDNEYWVEYEIKDSYFGWCSIKKPLKFMIEKLYSHLQDDNKLEWV